MARPETVFVGNEHRFVVRDLKTITSKLRHDLGVKLQEIPGNPKLPISVSPETGFEIQRSKGSTTEKFSLNARGGNPYVEYTRGHTYDFVAVPHVVVDEYYLNSQAAVDKFKEAIQDLR